MRVDIRISHHDFDNYVDFAESEVFLPAPLEQMREFQAWGIALLSECPLTIELRKRDAAIPARRSAAYEALKPYLALEEGDVFISGMATVRFPAIAAGSIEIALYKGNGGEEFLHDDEGIAYAKRSWGEAATDQREYFLNFVSDWPFGSGSMRLHAGEECVISLDTDDCIPLRRYVEEPRKYGYRARGGSVANIEPSGS